MNTSSTSADATFDSRRAQYPGAPVLGRLRAEWCGPARRSHRVLDDVAKDYAGRLTVAKLDIDANPGTPAKYGIRGIPTLILFKGGEIAAQKVGALSKSQLTAFMTVTSEGATLLIHVNRTLRVARAT
jgi:thioredoxin 1